MKLSNGTNKMRLRMSHKRWRRRSLARVFWAPVLRGNGKTAVKRPRAELIFHFPHYDYENGGPASVIFLGHLKAYKRYETGELHLYDLAQDLGEQHDLAKQMPAQAAALERRMNQYLRAVNAQMATLNPHYDASKTRK